MGGHVDGGTPVLLQTPSWFQALKTQVTCSRHACIQLGGPWSTLLEYSGLHPLLWTLTAATSSSYLVNRKKDWGDAQGIHSISLKLSALTQVS